MLDLRAVTKGQIKSPKTLPLVLIPTIIIENGITLFQREVLTIFSDIAKKFDNTFLFVTSTNVTYTGAPRTADNGKNHITNEAIDIIIAARSVGDHIVTDPGFNYARSLLIWKIASVISHKIPNLAICLEDDHMHFHKATSRQIVMQTISGKQHRALNPNTSFFCDHKHSKIRDITTLCDNLFQ